MKFTKLSLIAALAVSSAFAGGDIAPVEPTVTAEAPASESDLAISANLAITSNYVWRGMTQTSNAPAVQGGIDLEYKGFYLGTWGSNVDFNTASDNSLEADFYAGYKNEIAGIGFDIGYILYTYPNSGASISDNPDELYLGLSKDFGMVGVNGKYSYALDDFNTDYWEIGGDVELPMELTFAASYGDYKDVGTNYIVSLSKEIGKFELNVAYTNFDADAASGFDDEDHVVATISTSF
ncbi:MAG: hypothetical protein P794_03570 [Epsilonproteobacteria bacterium (ex Lamellibrachia satsuma)]|nr:MAG: hypothetical protein P794_03570 [Epsilonproteobacteria bacterium (ex Lamellibrachia satsuma)]